MYKIFFNNKQNDYHRYISHAQYYTSQELALASITIKNELKKNLAFMPNEKGVDDVYVNILKSEQYNVYIVFSFSQSDVYFRLDYTPNNGEMWSALINRGENNINNTNQSFPNETDFEHLYAKPIKLLVLMYYDEIIHFIEEESIRLQKSRKVVMQINKDIEEATKKENVSTPTIDETKNVDIDFSDIENTPVFSAEDIKTDTAISEESIKNTRE